MSRYTLFAVTIALISCSLWAQKRAELDAEKSLKGQKDCERIRDLELVKSEAPLKINCQLDNMHFFSEVPLKQDSLPVRIGNFNLLHPGTDKTLFKDFSLVADLINEEFDLMAGIELMDVVATPRENNGKLLPVINKTLEELRTLELEILSFRGKIQELSNPVEELKLRLEHESSLRKISDIEVTINLKRSSLELLRKEIAYYSIPRFTILGLELGRLSRLENLERSQKQKIDLEKSLASLDEELNSAKSEAQSAEEKVKAFELRKLEAGSYQEKIFLLADKQNTLRTGLQTWTRHYRIPGYLKILEELRKLDPAWSLIVSPHGDAAVETNAQEFTGFFYRASKVAVEKNIHCSNRFGQESYACYPNFYADYMGEDLSGLFSRRPFLGTFSDGRSTFSVLAAHVVFESPTSPETQKVMLEKTFKVSSLAELPTGINKQNYARFIEVFLSLQMVEKLRSEGLQKIIYTGDLNLESVNPFWRYVFERFTNSKLLVDEKTSLSETRFSKGVETKGVSSNYDHFILSNDEDASCRNASVVNFMQNSISEKLRAKYQVRTEAMKGPYPVMEKAEELISQRSVEVQAKLAEYNFTLSNGGVVSEDRKTTAEDLQNFRQRVFDSQGSDETYYKMYVQLISDHLPIKLECQF